MIVMFESIFTSGINSVFSLAVNKVLNGKGITVTPSEWKGTFYASDNIGNKTMCKNATDAVLYEYNFILKIQNRNNETKVMHDIKVVFLQDKVTVCESQLKYDEDAVPNCKCSPNGRFEWINLEPQRYIELKVSGKYNKPIASLKRVNRVELQYIDTHNKEHKKTIMEKEYIEFFN